MRISDWSSDVCSSDLDACLAARDDRRVRDRQTQRVAEQRGDGEPVGDRADHGGFGERGDVAPGRMAGFEADRKSVAWGKSVSVRVDLGGRRIIKKNNTYNTT